MGAVLPPTPNMTVVACRSALLLEADARVLLEEGRRVDSATPERFQAGDEAPPAARLLLLG